MDSKSSSFSFLLDQRILPEFLRVHSFSMTFCFWYNQWDASTLTESVGTSILLSTSDQGTRYQGTILKGKAKDINMRNSSKVFQNHAIMITISHIIHCNRILYLLIHSNCITHTVYCLRTDAVLYKLYFNISKVSISYCMTSFFWLQWSCFPFGFFETTWGPYEAFLAVIKGFNMAIFRALFCVTLPKFILDYLNRGWFSWPTVLKMLKRFGPRITHNYSKPLIIFLQNSPS